MLIIYSLLALTFSILQSASISALEDSSTIETIKILLETMLSIELLTALIVTELIKATLLTNLNTNIVRAGALLLKFVIVFAIIKISFINLPDNFNNNIEHTIKLPIINQTTTSIFNKQLNQQ
jgi:hypothetical protein